MEYNDTAKVSYYHTPAKYTQKYIITFVVIRYVYIRDQVAALTEGCVLVLLWLQVPGKV